MMVFRSALGSSLHPKFKIAWGGRGGVASLSYLTGRVPTLLTSIVLRLRGQRTN